MEPQCYAVELRLRVTPSAPVHLPSMPHGNCEHDESPVLNIANDAVIADPKAPEAYLASLQRFAEMARVLAPLEALIEPVENPFPDLRIELAELPLRGIGNLNGPGQALP